MSSEIPSLTSLEKRLSRKTSTASTSLDASPELSREENGMTLSLGHNPLGSRTRPYQGTWDIIIDTPIGQGAYGQVFRALNRNTGRFLAVKTIQIDLSKDNWQDKLSTLEREIALLRSFEHPHIVKYLDSEREQQGFVHIYLEYMPGGSLSTMLKQYGSFPENLISKFTKQILLGLHYLHVHGVVHRDLKGGNILASADGTVKIADFGASKYIKGLPLISNNSELCKSIKGSLFWMAPEVLREEGYGRKVDIWSLGCVVVEMATGTHPWASVKTYYELCSAMAQGKTPEVPQHLSPDCQNFLAVCLQHDKKLRPTTGVLLKHPFVAKIA